MRLFLSSYRAGKHDADLRELLGKIDKVAVITNAKDYKTPEGREVRVKENFDYWKSLDIEPTEVDLRPYFHKSGAEKLLAKHNFIWLAGGNVFLLRRALSYTGLDTYFYDAVRKNEIILGGESAGAIIMGPTLQYSEMEAEGHEDSPSFVAEGYESGVIWNGMDFITYVPVPHYKDVDYGEEIDDYIARLEKASIPYKTITNDQAIIINGDKEEFLK
jgi:dipeptidase E